MKPKVLCEYDREFVSFRIIEENTIVEYFGEEVHYNQQRAICNKCGNEIYVASVNDENLERIAKEYEVLKNG